MKEADAGRVVSEYDRFVRELPVTRISVIIVGSLGPKPPATPMHCNQRNVMVHECVGDLNSHDPIMKHTVRQDLHKHHRVLSDIIDWDSR